MGLFHKSLTDALAAIASNDLPKALKILQEHEDEHMIDSWNFKGLAHDIEEYDTNLREAIFALRKERNEKTKKRSAKSKIEACQKALADVKEKINILREEEILLE